MDGTCPCRLCAAEKPTPVDVVFLDFDGVINTGAGPWLPEKMRWLNRITDQTGAVIVVHSTWRYGRSIDDLRRILTDRNGRAAQIAQAKGEILAVCPVPEGAKKQHATGLIVLDDEDFKRFAGGLPTKWKFERPAAIQAWMNKHPGLVRRFVILDDATEFAHLAPQHIHTHTRIGLTKAHADQAIKMLKGIKW